MLYSKRITVAANTSEVNKTKTSVKVTNGVIHRIGADFPPGSNWKSHVQVFDGGHQIWPQPFGSEIHGSGLMIESQEFHEIEDAPRQLDIYTWNTDTTDAHDITVYIHMLPKWVLLPAFATEGIINALRSLFKR